MSFSSVSNGLEQLFGTVPGLKTIERGDEVRVGARGSVVPEPEQTPLLRITRGPERERPWTHDGDYDRRTPYTCELYDYARDLTTAADNFADLAEDVRRQVRNPRCLEGVADTPTTRVINTSLLPLRMTGRAPRALSKAKDQTLLHERFVVEVREGIRS